MNFHNKIVLDRYVAELPLVYQPAPRHAEPRISPKSEILAMAGAPILGSRYLFPQRFDKVVDKLLADPCGTGISPHHAVRYFSSAVHLDLNPAALTNRLNDYVLEPRGARWMGTSFLDAAEWGAVLSPIDASPIHREMCELVAAGSNYRDSQAYRNLVRAIELGRPSSRNGMLMTNVDEIEAYFSYCRDLIKSARKRGVVRHRVSGAFHRLRVKHRDIRSIVLDSQERDIGVAIAADGEIVRHLGGKHRTAIAQALKLPWIPVEVRLVHVSWLVRQMKSTGLPAHQALAQGVAEIRTALAAGK
jgi:hypothetical protein